MSRLMPGRRGNGVTAFLGYTNSAVNPGRRRLASGCIPITD